MDTDNSSKPSNSFNTILLLALVLVIAGYFYVDYQEKQKQELRYQQQQQIEQQYRQTRKLHTLEAYETFIAAYPNSKPVDQARYYRDELALEEAKAEHSSEAIEAFIQRYPKSSWQSAARWWRDKLKFEELKALGSVSEYEKFLKSYPDSHWKDNAIFERDALLYKQAKTLNTLDAYKTFLANHPKSAYKEKAEFRLKRLQKSIGQRNAFLSTRDIHFRRFQDSSVGELIENSDAKLTGEEIPLSLDDIDLAKFDKQTKVVLISAYEGPTATVKINVPGEKIVVLLSSYNKIEWYLDIASNTEVQAVVVGSQKGGGKLKSNNKGIRGYLLNQRQFRYVRNYEEANFREILLWLNRKNPAMDKIHFYSASYKTRQPVELQSLFDKEEWTLDWPKVQQPKQNMSFSLTQEMFGDKPFSLLGPEYENPQVAPIIRPNDIALVKNKGVYFKISHNGIDKFDMQTWRKVAHYPLPTNFEPFSHPKGIAYDSKNNIIAVASSGGDGAFYRFDVESEIWKDYRSFNGVIDPDSLAYSEEGEYFAASTYGKQGLIILSPDGRPMEHHNLTGKLLGYKQTNSGRTPSLSIIAKGDQLALLLISSRHSSRQSANNIVTRIWSYNRKTQQAELTYKFDMRSGSEDVNDRGQKDKRGRIYSYERRDD